VTARGVRESAPARNMLFPGVPSGPWWTVQNHLGGWSVRTGRARDIEAGRSYAGTDYGAHVVMGLGDHTDPRTENEAAIATAVAALPQLVEALRDLLHEDGGSLAHSANHPKCVAARAALAAACGEPS
jgi:hypothetical protein